MSPRRNKPTITNAINLTSLITGIIFVVIGSLWRFREISTLRISPHLILCLLLSWINWVVLSKFNSWHKRGNRLMWLLRLKRRQLTPHPILLLNRSMSLISEERGPVNQKMFLLLTSIHTIRPLLLIDCRGKIKPPSKKTGKQSKMTKFPHLKASFNMP